MADIWLIRLDSNRFRSFTPKVPPDGRIFVGLVDAFQSGEPFGDRWQPTELGLFQGEMGAETLEKEKRIPDFAHGVVALMVSAKARSILESIIIGHVEFLSLETVVGPYYELNIKLVDCLDSSRSVVSRFKSSGRIKTVVKYALLRGRIDGIPIFRIPELGISPVFCSDEFKTSVEVNRLSGVVFEPVPLLDSQPKDVDSW